MLCPAEHFEHRAVACHIGNYVTLPPPLLTDMAFLPLYSVYADEHEEREQLKRDVYSLSCLLTRLQPIMRFSPHWYTSRMTIQLPPMHPYDHLAVLVNACSAANMIIGTHIAVKSVYVTCIEEGNAPTRI